MGGRGGGEGGEGGGTYHHLSGGRPGGLPACSPGYTFRLLTPSPPCFERGERKKEKKKSRARLEALAAMAARVSILG